MYVCSARLCGAHARVTTELDALAGIFPIPGVTTVPVMIAIYLFRLNPVAAMLTNYLCTPLNVAAVPLFM